MAKFRKKPVEVGAKQWWPPGDQRHDPEMLSHRKGNAVTPGDYRQKGDLWQFSTIPGMGDDIFLLRLYCGSDVRVSPGDWVVTASGRKWAVEADVFEAIYEPAEMADAAYDEAADALLPTFRVPSSLLKPEGE